MVLFMKNFLRDQNEQEDIIQGMISLADKMMQFH
jgi:hypothetical protein